MRELKFRIWIKDEERYYDESDEESYMIVPNGNVTYTSESYEEDGVWFTDTTSATKDVIVEQYTGLKDKNGKEIYEGDIVRWSFKVDRNSELTYTSDAVKWESYAEEEWPYSTISGFTLPESEDGYEVIGNVHENPELLNLPRESPPQTDG